jgi:Zinc finger, C3HC4 type (RING finger)
MKSTSFRAGTEACDGDWEWKDFKHVQTFENSLRCPLCDSLLKSAVFIPSCNHLFCSSCIRQHLNTNDFCPSCRTKAEESQLKPNIHIQRLVLLYEIARPSLLELTKGAARPASDIYQKAEAAASKVAFLVDKTLPWKTNSEFSRLPTRNFKSMSHQKLVDECNKLGLPPGIDAAWRLTRFTELHNEQGDSLIPKSKTEIISMIDAEENSRESARSDLRRLQRLPAHTGQFIVGSSNLLGNDDVVVVEEKSKKGPKNDSKVVISTQPLPVDGCGPDKSTAVKLTSNQLSKFAEMRDALKKRPRVSGAATNDLANSIHVTEAPGKESTIDDFSLPPEWRVLHSVTLDGPFYFNVATGIGQTKKPMYSQAISKPPSKDVVESSSNEPIIKESTSSSIDSPLDSNSMSKRPKVNISDSKIMTPVGWTCPSCTLVNMRRAKTCKACETARPPTEV